jgi:hypothetical protein
MGTAWSQRAAPREWPDCPSARLCRSLARTAATRGNKSFLPRSRGDFATALQLLDQARQLVPDDPIVRSWAMALEAMTKAWAHKPAESLVALEAAEGVLENATPDAAPAWFDYYDRPRLAG